MITVLPKQQGDRFVPVRKSYIDLCGDMSAGILLAIFEYWTSVKISGSKQIESENKAREKEGIDPIDYDVWIYKTHDNLIEDSLGLLKMYEVKSGLNILLDKGFLQKRNNPKYKWDRTIQYKLDTKVVIRSMHQSPVTNGTDTSNQAIPENTYKEKLFNNKLLNNCDPMVSKKESEEFNNILELWNIHVSDFRELAKHNKTILPSDGSIYIRSHRRLTTKISYDPYKSKTSIATISEAIVLACEMGLTVEDIKIAIANYFNVLTSEDYFYSYQFQTLPHFLLADNGAIKFRSIKFTETLRCKFKDNNIFKKLRDSYVPVLFTYNSGNVLDDKSQTYMSVPLGICKNRKIEQIFNELNDCNDAKMFDRHHFVLLEETIASAFYQKCDISTIEKLIKMHEENLEVV